MIKRIVAILLLLTSAAAAQEPEPTPSPASRTIARWFDLQMATFFMRYRFVENSAGVVTSNQFQYKESIRGRIKFDAKGRYSLNAGVFSGTSFISSWNNSGWGTGNAQGNLALKQLYFSAEPVKGVEFQYGGLYILRGDATEITTYDDDGYIMGERVSLKRPDKLFFDEVSVTYAYLGDLGLPNINKRYHHLKKSNYHQFLVEKKIGKRAAVTADYTFDTGRESLRGTLRLNVPELRVLDTIRFENYERLDTSPVYDFALHGEKTLGKRVTLGGGYIQIDPRFGNLNSDRFLNGKRLFLTSTIRLTSEISVQTLATHTVANHTSAPLHTRIDFILSYNLLKGLQRLGLF